MNRTAITTLPFSYSKTCDTFRPLVRHSATRRAGLGGESFIYFLVPCAMLNSLVRKLISEGRPACIKNGLRHAGFCESCRVHITYGDVIKLSYDAMRKLVNEVAALGRDLRVNLSRLPLLARTLGFAKRFFELAVVTWVVDLLASGKRSEILEAQVNANTTINLAARNIFNINDNVQKPVAARVLRKVASIKNFAFWEGAAIEHFECLFAELKSIAISFKRASLKRNPSKILLPAISKIGTLRMKPGASISLANSIDSIGMQPKFLAAASGKLIQVKATKPFSAKSQSIFLAVITIVPDKIHRTSFSVKKPIQ